MNKLNMTQSHEEILKNSNSSRRYGQETKLKPKEKGQRKGS